MFEDNSYVKSENEYVDEDKLQQSRAAVCVDILGEGFKVDRVDDEWVVVKEFGNECGILIKDGTIFDDKIMYADVVLFQNDDPTDAIDKMYSSEYGEDIQKAVDELYERSKVYMEKKLKEREEEVDKKPEISHISMDANESVTFSNWDGSKVTVSKVPTDYGICRYTVTIEGHAEVITDLGGDSPEVSAEQRAVRNDDINDGKKGEIRYAKSGPARTIVTFGESERLHDYGGGLYGGEIAIYKDLITREYIVSVVGNVEVIHKEKEEENKDEE